MAATDETRSAVNHLLRRSGFVCRAEEVDRMADLGYDAVVALVTDHRGIDPGADAVPVPTFSDDGRAARSSNDPAVRQAAQDRGRIERQTLVAWWVERMIAAERPHREKLTFLWHDHFATSMQKVDVASLMYQQRATLHQEGGGRFDHLVASVARDPAMLWWLDGHSSTREAPNENFARELFELFTLGHGTHGGEPPYSEGDVAEAARALTGWDIDRTTGAARFDANRHDPGPMTVFGQTGSFDLDDVAGLATSHPACAPHVVARLWSRLGRPATENDPVVVELAARFAEDLDVTALLRRIYTHPEFLAPASRTALVKTPVELLVGLARALELPLDPRMIRVLQRLGQVPFYPPDVSGWPADDAWLSTASALTVLEVATTVAELAQPTELVDAPPSDRPDVAARLLGVDQWGPTTAAALRSAASDPQAVLVGAVAAPEHLLA